MAAIRFHLDEHIHPGIAVGLRARGIGVTTTLDAGLSGADDPEQLAYAFGEGRVVVTNDHNFTQLHADGAEHAGIVYCRRGKYSVGELLQAVILAHACYTAEEMVGRVEFL